MRVRHYIDPTTGQTHIYKHNVAESEVEEVLAHPGEDRAGSDGARGGHWPYWASPHWPSAAQAVPTELVPEVRELIAKHKKRA